MTTMETTASASSQKVSRTGAIPNLHGSVSHLRSWFILHCAQRWQLRAPNPSRAARPRSHGYSGGIEPLPISAPADKQRLQRYQRRHHYTRRAGPINLPVNKSAQGEHDNVRFARCRYIAARHRNDRQNSRHPHLDMEHARRVAESARPPGTWRCGIGERRALVLWRNRRASAPTRLRQACLPKCGVAATAAPCSNICLARCVGNLSEACGRAPPPTYLAPVQVEAEPRRVARGTRAQDSRDGQILPPQGRGGKASRHEHTLEHEAAAAANPPSHDAHALIGCPGSCTGTGQHGAEAASLATFCGARLPGPFTGETLGARL